MQIDAQGKRYKKMKIDATVQYMAKKHEEEADPAEGKQAWTVRYDEDEAELIRRVSKIKSLKPGTCIRSLSVEAARRFLAEHGAK